jgi:dTDP-4-dehydrorhamnose 3,5-epimerase-like enzyme
MDGIVNVNDIAPIVRYWGNSLFPREDKKGIDWSPQNIPVSYSFGDECLAYADANGDGDVNIGDVAAVYFPNIAQWGQYH